MGKMTNEERRVFNGIVRWMLNKDTEPPITWCETEAQKEIKGLPDDARHHLQHIYRNFLQSVMAGIEMHDLEAARDAIWDVSEKLRRLGL